MGLYAENLEKALPPHKLPAVSHAPEGARLTTLSNAHWMLDDIPAAAGAMEAAAGPENRPDNRTDSMSRSRWDKGR
ncbi:MAG: hypothetical protein GY850_28655 [bacterium]|nr:hypothetical protein [bacterium]